MLTLSNTSTEDLGKLFSSLFSEEVRICSGCNKVELVDGTWRYPETNQEGQRMRRADLDANTFCPECMRKLMHAA